MTVSIEPAKTILASLIENLSVFEQSEISRNEPIGSLVGEFKFWDSYQDSAGFDRILASGKADSWGRSGHGAKRTVG